MSNPFISPDLAIGIEGAPAAPSQQTYETSSSKVDGGAVRMDSNGVVNEVGTLRYTHTPERNTSDGVLASAKSSGGAFGMEVRDDSSVMTADGEMSVAAACAMGYLTRTCDGYRDTSRGTSTSAPPSASTPAAPQVAPQAAQGIPNVPLLAETTKALTHLRNSLPSGLVDSVMANAIANGPASVNPAVFDDSGMSRAEGAEYVKHIFESMSAQADAALANKGIDGGAFREWAQEVAPGQFRECMRVHAETGKTSAYSQLAAAYLASTGPSDAAMAAAGVKTRINKAGDTEVYVPGLKTWTTYEAAVHAGLIS